MLLATSSFDDFQQDSPKNGPGRESYQQHPAVFVDITNSGKSENDIARVVVISRNFHEDSVPSNLRGKVVEYFPKLNDENTKITVDGTTKYFSDERKDGLFNLL